MLFPKGTVLSNEKRGGSIVVPFDMSHFKQFALRNADKSGCPVTGMKQWYSNVVLENCWRYVNKMFAEFFKLVDLRIPICHG